MFIRAVCPDRASLRVRFRGDLDRTRTIAWPCEVCVCKAGSGSSFMVFSAFTDVWEQDRESYDMLSYDLLQSSGFHRSLEWFSVATSVWFDSKSPEAQSDIMDLTEQLLRSDQGYLTMCLASIVLSCGHDVQVQALLGTILDRLNATTYKFVADALLQVCASCLQLDGVREATAYIVSRVPITMKHLELFVSKPCPMSTVAELVNRLRPSKKVAQLLSDDYRYHMLLYDYMMNHNFKPARFSVPSSWSPAQKLAVFRRFGVSMCYEVLVELLLDASYSLHVLSAPTHEGILTDTECSVLIRFLAHYLQEHPPDCRATMQMCEELQFTKSIECLHCITRNGITHA